VFCFALIPPTSTYSYHRSTSLLFKFSHCSTIVNGLFNHPWRPVMHSEEFSFKSFKPMNCCRLLAKHDSPFCLSICLFFFASRIFTFTFFFSSSLYFPRFINLLYWTMMAQRIRGRSKDTMRICRLPRGRKGSKHGVPGLLLAYTHNGNKNVCAIRALWLSGKRPRNMYIQEIKGTGIGYGCINPQRVWNNESPFWNIWLFLFKLSGFGFMMQRSLIQPSLAIPT